MSASETPITTTEAASLLHRCYGMPGDVSPLAGEKDLNFLVKTPAGAQYILKVSHPGERMDIVRAQNDALAHIASIDAGLPVSAVICSVDGTFAPCLEISDGSARIVRLFSYLHGILLHETTASAAQDRALGAFLARLGRALRDFVRVQPRPDLEWDLNNLPNSRPLLREIDDAAVRSTVQQAYDDFERHVGTVLSSLRAQAIHNDMNPYNVVVDPRDPTVVAGIIDFGDMVHGALACDIAVGAAYRWTLGEHPLAGAARFMQGYATVREILPSELDVLPDLLRGRLALTINIANWQSLHEPGNRAYVLRLQGELQRALTHLAKVPRSEGRRFLREAVGAS